MCNGRYMFACSVAWVAGWVAGAAVMVAWASWSMLRTMEHG
jgi:hypothetical protein